MVLVLSSLVSGSRVGGAVSVSALQARGIDTMHVPTVLLGRHPGWGDPGGGAIADDLFSGALDGIEANGLFALTDAVLTGYFATPGQVRRAAAAIDAVRAVQTRTAHNVCAYAPEPVIVVDPIIGDHGRLYVPDAVAEAIRDELVPRADLVTPNAFELGWLTGLPVRNAGEALTAAKALGKPVLASSIENNYEIGVLYADAHGAFSLSHVHLDDVPNGTGDLLTASFLAERLLGSHPKIALERAATAVWDTLEKAKEWRAFELPDVTARLQPVGEQSHLHAKPVSGNKPQWVVGVDGCPFGWVGVWLDLSGLNEPAFELYEAFDEVLSAERNAEIIAVDMPIGLLDISREGGRECEVEARRLLPGRKSSVFSSPVRQALSASTHGEANRINRENGGNGLSQQAFRIGSKIAEIDAVMNQELESRIYETHPECAFATLAGHPMKHNKKRSAGRNERMDVLASNGFPEESLGFFPFPYKSAAPDDIIDAAVCALTAARILRGEARSIPETPPRDSRGLRMAIFA